MKEGIVCKTCKFFYDGSQGECRRYAPRAANSLDLFIGEAIISIADILCQRWSDVKWPEGIESEGTEAVPCTPLFPEVSGRDDWCGEWEGLE